MQAAFWEMVWDESSLWLSLGAAARGPGSRRNECLHPEVYLGSPPYLCLHVQYIRDQGSLLGQSTWNCNPLISYPLYPILLLSMVFIMNWHNIFLKIFLIGPFLKSLLNLLQYCFCFMFWFFWSRGMWDLSSPTRDQTRTPCIGRCSLNHWTAREALNWHPV